VQPVGDLGLRVELTLQTVSAHGRHRAHESQAQCRHRTHQVIAGITELAECTQQDLGRPLAGPALVDGRQGGLNASVGVGEQHLLLAGEIGEERAGADVGRRGDVCDRRAVITPPLEQLGGGVDQCLPGAGALALTQ
jgi:hypothetical protein